MSIPAYTTSVHHLARYRLRAHADSADQETASIPHWRYTRHETYIRLVGTNADIRKGNGTGSPVSGCIDELTTTIAVSPCTSNQMQDGLALFRSIISLLITSSDPTALRSGLLDQPFIPLDVELCLLELRGRREEGERRGGGVKIPQPAAWVTLRWVAMDERKSGP